MAWVKKNVYVTPIKFISKTVVRIEPKNEPIVETKRILPVITEM